MTSAFGVPSLLPFRCYVFATFVCWCAVADTPCPAGHFRPPHQPQSCFACPVGRHQSLNETFSSVCPLCEPGQVAPRGARECSQCRAGLYDSQWGDHERCLECPAGQYAGSSGATACHGCVPGRYAARDGASVCAPCPVGKYTRANRAQKCALCPAGRFNSVGVHNKWTGLWTKLQKRAQAQGLKHQWARLWLNAACELCANGKFQPRVGQGKCEACPMGRFRINGGLPQEDAMALGGGGGATSDAAVTEERARAANATACRPYRFYRAAEERLKAEVVARRQRHNGTAAATPAAAAAVGPTPAPSPGVTAPAPCRPGTHFSIFDASCAVCPVGRFAQGTGLTECTACHSGRTTHWGDGDSAGACYACPPGWYGRSAQGKVRHSTAAAILAGAPRRTQPVLMVCTPCAAGRYQPDAARLGCLHCPAGTAFAGSESGGCADFTDCCRRCAAGKYLLRRPPSGNASSLGSTASGATEHNDDCVSCPVGKYKGLTSAACEACPAGTFTDSSSPTARGCTLAYKCCWPCPEGHFSNVSAARTCLVCPTGQYQGFAGHSFCIGCPAGRSTTAAGATRDINCTTAAVRHGMGSTAAAKPEYAPCPPGRFYALERRHRTADCHSCEPGKFAPSSGAEVCWECPAGKFASGAASDICTACAAGHFQPDPGRTSCKLCLQGRQQPHAGQTFCSAVLQPEARGAGACCDPKLDPPSRHATCKFSTTSSGLAITELRGLPTTDATVYRDCQDALRRAPDPSSRDYLIAENSRGSHLRGLGHVSDGSTGGGRKATRSVYCDFQSLHLKADSPAAKARLYKCAMLDLGVRCACCDCPKHCPLGTYAATQPGGQIECTPCLAGRFAPTTGAHSCAPCPVGKYQPSKGQPACFVRPPAPKERCCDPFGVYFRSKVFSCLYDAAAPGGMRTVQRKLGSKLKSATSHDGRTLGLGQKHVCEVAAGKANAHECHCCDCPNMSAADFVAKFDQLGKRHGSGMWSSKLHSHV